MPGPTFHRIPGIPSPHGNGTLLLEPFSDPPGPFFSPLSVSFYSYIIVSRRSLEEKFDAENLWFFTLFSTCFCALVARSRWCIWNERVKEVHEFSSVTTAQDGRLLWWVLYVYTILSEILMLSHGEQRDTLLGSVVMQFVITKPECTEWCSDVYQIFAWISGRISRRNFCKNSRR